MIIEKYLWANLTTLLAIYDKDDNLVQRYNYTESRTPTSMTMNNETYYLHYDQVGTLRVVTDKNKNIVKEISYDTYGNILSEKNPSFTVAFGFGGGLRDRDTNLVHFGYREYEPYTGKWTAKDPIDFGGGDSNLYGYVLGDPVGLIDSKGLYDDPRLYRATGSPATKAQSSRNAAQIAGAVSAVTALIPNPVAQVVSKATAIIAISATLNAHQIDASQGIFNQDKLILDLILIETKYTKNPSLDFLYDEGFGAYYDNFCQ